MRFSLLKEDIDKLLQVQINLIDLFNENTDTLLQSLSDLCKETNAQSFQMVSNILINYINDVVEIVLRKSVAEWNEQPNSLVKVAERFRVGEASVTLAKEYQNQFETVITEAYKHKEKLTITFNGEALVTNAHVERIAEIGNEFNLVLDGIRIDTLAAISKLYDENILAYALEPLIIGQLNELQSLNDAMITTAQEVVCQLLEIDRKVASRLEEEVATIRRDFSGSISNFVMSEDVKNNSGDVVSGSVGSSMGNVSNQSSVAETAKKQAGKIAKLLSQDLDTPEKVLELKTEYKLFTEAIKELEKEKKNKGKNPDRWKSAKHVFKKVTTGLKRFMSFIGGALAVTGGSIDPKDPISGSLLRGLGTLVTDFSSGKDVDVEKLLKLSSPLSKLDILDLPEKISLSPEEVKNGKDPKDVLKGKISDYLEPRLVNFDKELMNIVLDPKSEEKLIDLNPGLNQDENAKHQPNTAVLGGSYQQPTKTYDASIETLRPLVSLTEIDEACQRLSVTILDNRSGYFNSEDIEKLQAEISQLKEFLRQEGDDKFHFGNNVLILHVLQKICTAAHTSGCHVFSPDQFSPDQEFDRSQVKQLVDIVGVLDSSKMNGQKDVNTEMEKLIRNILCSSNSYPCQNREGNIIITNPSQLISLVNSGIGRFYVQEETLANVLTETMGVSKSAKENDFLYGLSSLVLPIGIALMPFSGGLSVPVIAGAMAVLSVFCKIGKNEFQAMAALQATIGQEATKSLLSQYKPEQEKVGNLCFLLANVE